MPATNCFTLRSRELEEGIRTYENPQGFTEVRLGNEERCCRALFGARGWLHPLHENGLLLRAGPFRFNDYPRLVYPPDWWPGAMIHIVARSLDLPYEPLAENLTFNAGAEGLPTFLLLGKYRECEIKEQIFSIEKGERLFVIDRKQAVAVLEYSEGIITMREASREEVCAYLLETGRNLTDVRSLDWTMSMLKRLGVEDISSLERQRSLITCG